MIERLLREKNLPTSSAPKILDNLVYSRINLGSRTSLLSRVSISKTKIFIYTIVLFLIGLSIFIYVAKSKDFDRGVGQVAQMQIDDTMDDIDNVLDSVDEENYLNY